MVATIFFLSSPSIVSFLSSTNLCVCACAWVCVFVPCNHVWAIHPPPHSCVGISGSGKVCVCVCGGAVYCMCQWSHRTPLTSSTKTLVLSASALRSRCGISQRTKLQSDQLFKLQLSTSEENSRSCVYLAFLVFFLHTFIPAYKAAQNRHTCYGLTNTSDVFTTTATCITKVIPFFSSSWRVSVVVLSSH